jgi:hypothetical protein
VRFKLVNLWPRARRHGPQTTADNAASAAEADSVTYAELQRRRSARPVNRFYLSGVLAADPVPAKDPYNRPIVMLLITFAPDRRGSAQSQTADREVELSAQLAARHARSLQAGYAVFVSGHFSHGGAITATDLYSGPPED